MMSRHLVFYGKEILSQVAQPVENIDDDVISLIDEMFKIMYKEKGVGLAAPQVDLARRIVVIDTGENKGEKIAIINPVITGASDRFVPYEEGCLSLPGINADVVRPDAVLVKGISPRGKEMEIEAKGFLARVFQHEIDHLEGILFIDRVEKYIRDELRSDLKKIKKLNKQAG